MGYPWRVTVKDSVKEVAAASDQVVVRLDPGRALGPDETREVVAQVLEERGWEPVPGAPGTWRQEGPDGTERTFDVAAMEATVSAGRQEDVEVQGEDQVSLGDWASGRCASPDPCPACPFRRPMTQAQRDQAVADAEARLRRRLEQEARRRAEERERELAGEVLHALEEQDQEARHELEMVSREVTARALKIRARALGQVTEVQESDPSGAQYELTITIVEPQQRSAWRPARWNPQDEERLARRAGSPGQLDLAAMASWAYGGARLVSFVQSRTSTGWRDHVVTIGPVEPTTISSLLEDRDLLVNWSELAMHSRAAGRPLVMLAAAVPHEVVPGTTRRRATGSPAIVALAAGPDGRCITVDGSGTEVVSPALERALRHWIER